MSKPADKDAMACNKPRRTPGHAKKSHVVKACFDGKEKLIRFGEQGASTAGKPKAGESERMKTKRASFKSRHAKNIAKGPSSPAYWANKVKWAEGGEVKMAAGGSAALALIEQMRRSAGQSPEFDPTLVAMREQRARPARRPAPQAAPRMSEPQAAQPREAPLPLPPVPPAMRPDENPPPEAPRNPMRFDEGNPHVATAIRMAEKYNLPRDIFLSLVQQESRFDPNARSRRGAIGLGQLMPGTARELGVDPTDPEQNLEGSARYLRQMLDRFKDMPLALAAYNAGPGRVARAGNTIPNIRETRNYVPSILRRAGANVPEGLGDLDRKYAEGGRVRRTLRDEMRDIEAEIRGERPTSMGVTIARGFGEGAGGITSVARRGAARAAAEAAENPRAVIGGNRPPRMTPDEAMAIATARQPGAGVPRLEGEDLERANELSQRVLDFRASQMRLPPAQRIQPRPEDQLFAPARFDRPLEAGPESAALDLEALRIENIAPRQQLPGSRAGAGVASDLARNYGPTTDRIVEELGPIARLMRGEAMPDATAAQIASARSGEFYNMRPVYDVLRDAGVPHDEAIRRIRQEAQAIAGTSPRTDTEQNVLNSSFLQNRMARGLPVDAESVQAATGPGSGYGMIYDQHPALTRGLLEGEISLAQNPKPSIFARNISGDRSAVTADVHNVRAINMLYNDVNPGGLPASSFDTAGDYRLYRDAYTPDADGNIRGMTDAELREILVARPSGQGIRKQDVSTEYPIYNDITTQVAERLGLTPADTQALMWFHYGPRTGLASDAHTVPELLNQRMSITAQGLDMSPDEVMRLYSRNMIPLAGAAPAALLLPDNEPGRSLEDLDQKYAEGGEVESDPQPRGALNRVRNYLYSTFMRPNDMGMEADARAKAEGIPGGAGGPRDAIRHMIASSYTSPRGVAAVEFLQGDTLNSLVGDNQATWDRANNALGQRLRSVPESERYDRAKDMVLQQLRHLVEYGDMSGTLPSFDPRFTVVDRNAEGREIVYGPREIIGWIESGRMPSLSDDSRVLRSDIYTPGSIGDRLRPASRRERAPASVPATPNNFAEGGLAQLEQKYAEGGEVSAMPYNPDAVDALVKEIEAEYV